MDRKKFVEKMFALATIYGAKENTSEIVLDMYYTTISSVLTEVEFNNAVNDVLRTRKYSNFPTPAEFIEIAKGSKDNQEKEKLVDAEDKFRQILKTGRSIKCDDWAIHSVIKKMGGLDEIRQGKIENEKWLIKEFLEKYQVEIQKKNVGTDIPEILYTKKDLLNIQNDMQILPEKIIGDVEQYQRWIAVLENRKKKEVTYDNNMAR